MIVAGQRGAVVLGDMGSNDLAAAQADFRQAHVNGGTGVLASGFAWLAAGLIWLGTDHRTAFAALFIAGLAIAPVAALLSKWVFRAPSSDEGKRLERIAIFTLPIILAGFYFGWRQIDTAPDIAIPLVACGVGLRYLIFPIMFGKITFLVLGSAFILLGLANMAVGAPPFGNIALALGLIELATGGLLCRQWRSASAEGG